MLPSWSVIVSIVTLVNLIIPPFIDVSAESSLCKRSEVLDAIKNYLERDDFSEMITKPLVRANPIAFWNNVIQIDDICNSREAILLQKYCYDFPNVVKKVLIDTVQISLWIGLEIYHWPYLSDWVSFGSGDLVFFGLTSGKRPLHYCQLVNPVPPEEGDFEYGYLNSVLENLLKPKRVDKFDERVNFSFAVRHRFQKDAEKEKVDNELKYMLGNVTLGLRNLTADVHNLTLRVQNLTDVVAVVVDRINYHHKDHPSGQLSGEKSLEIATNFTTRRENGFSNCTSTCSELNKRHLGTYENDHIIDCCRLSYKYQEGRCENSIPKCSKPKDGASHSYIPDCNKHCEGKATYYKSSDIRDCCSKHDFPSGVCDEYMHTVCWHYSYGF
ncbi:hypothetical protein Fcan01_26824 [Folsomia candida]|uniref:Uncharacterized protein n=1 Tax=Folsomia candida TaxID=158441 RepID=A0A226CYM2_FOLCA|nr:hypothetical protein Fcan01_26824 [Folsomia candida]